MQDKKGVEIPKKIGVLSIISLVIGMGVFIFSWFPYVGCFGGPAAVVGVILGVIAATNKKVKWQMPVAGIVLSAASIFTACMVSHLSAKKEKVENQLQRAGEQIMTQMLGSLQDVMMERLDYIQNHMEMSDTEAKYQADEEGQRNPAVRFKIKNNGDRALGLVKVSVFFMDETEAIVGTADLYPVNTKSSREPTEPLEPNGVWQMEEGEYLTITGDPNDWEEGNVDMKIFDINFIIDKK